ncbi:MAG TPA: NifU family protein [Candidatus Polarisedimenticolaceae bacterium]|nr:NifU family protein [Candidatus Polarisedimenticolaceae bacterium]
MIRVTDRAKAKFLEIVRGEGRESDGLRVIVEHGGTARAEFALNFVGPGDGNEDDVVEDVGPFKVHIDPTSAKYLEEASVDYVDGLDDSGFKVDAPHAGIAPPKGPVAEAVRKVLEEKVNPAVANHGGFVELVAVEDDTAYLRFGGGCQGCGMINVTLKQGVEKILFAEVAGISKVMDVTDHAAGTNPYYQPAK